MSKPYRCSFCGKYDYEVWKLIAGVTAFICDGCVDMCTDIVRKGRAEQPDHNKEETMSDNADLYKEIHALQFRLDSRDLDLQTLTNRVETNKADQQHRLSLTERQIKKDRDAILEKLDQILQRLPEPPQGFDE